MKLTEQQIEKAARWWAYAVSAPKFGGCGDLAAAVAAARTQRVSEQMRLRFMREAKKALSGDVSATAFSVKFSPSPALARVLNAAGICTCNAPFFHSTEFRDGGIYAKRTQKGIPEYLPCLEAQGKSDA